MSVFDFSLQKVLELRERQEEQSARELAEARQEAHEARQLHTDLQAARDAGRARMARANWLFSVTAMAKAPGPPITQSL